jgi:hypothetical protein
MNTIEYINIVVTDINFYRVTFLHWHVCGSDNG